MSTKQELQAQLDAVNAENAKLRVDKHSGLVPVQDQMMQEMNALTKVSVNMSNKIAMKIIDDHKNVALYHTNGYHIGKLVGPLHPANAKVEMELFAKRGIVLSVRKPSEEEIATYQATDEYKRLSVAFDKGRARKQKTRGKGEIDKLAKAIAKLSGKEVVNAIADAPLR